MPCVRHLLRTADRAQLRAQVVAALRRGEACVLPTETVYGLAVLPSHPQATARIAALEGPAAPPRQRSLHIAARDDLQRLGVRASTAAQRLIERYWPGPLTLVLPTDAGGTAGVRLPAHDFTREVIAACGEPLWLATVHAPGQAPLADPEAVLSRCADAATLMVDDGPSPLGLASTVVRCIGDELEVVREGILTGEEVWESAASLVLFVCTGNTCRSPLAAALARELTGTALGVPPTRLLAHGFAFASAGTSTVPGMPASDGSLAAAAELGIDLGAHKSRPIAPRLLQRAARIYCLAQSHRLALLAEAPEVADRTALLRPDGLDIADPYGGDLRDYRRTRDEIRAALAARLAQWLPR